jgi:hypothetical protein
MPAGAHAAAAIYGTIVVLAVIVGVSVDPDAGAGYVLGGVLVTAGVFWAAHVYADVVADRLAGTAGKLRDRLRVAMIHDWPLVQAAFPPALPLVLGTVGLLGRDAAISLAIVVGVGELFAWGVAIGRVLGQGRLLALASGLLNASFGIVMVLLKALLHH